MCQDRGTPLGSERSHQPAVTKEHAIDTKNDQKHPPGPGTRSVWSGERGGFPHGASQTPVYRNVTYSYDDVDHWHAVATGAAAGHIYSRNTNPTVQVFEDKMRELDGAEAATSLASGMAAISACLFALLEPGRRVVSTKDTYGGTNKLFIEFLPRYRIDVALCDTDDHEAIESEIDAGCDILYLETPTNPTLKVVDIERLATRGHANGATVIVDNTVATPLNQRPLELGADLVLASASKFLGGHSDALGGAVSGRRDLVEAVYHYREIHGACLDPSAAYLLVRGLKTLELRLERQCDNAQRIAEHLERQPEVERVFYPGLASHPCHDIAARQMRRFGGMLSFSLKGGFDSVRRFLTRLELAHRAAHLGGVETIVGPPRTTSHVELTPEERAAAGIPEALVRYSVGIENVDDLVSDLDRALGGLG